ncbi:hypothetical protein OUZ56_006713 [Daphnia magna]|uniref:Uncharacterized protein n=1 Tax=Daphnia magna TaxID=35525 RepID=A0ABQ9YWG0_9CRUS|nr:hypothetical protein OUZ56_006713 [Daphnia magna]
MKKKTVFLFNHQQSSVMRMSPVCLPLLATWYSSSQGRQYRQTRRCTASCHRQQKVAEYRSRNGNSNVAVGNSPIAMKQLYPTATKSGSMRFYHHTQKVNLPYIKADRNVQLLDIR